MPSSSFSHPPAPHEHDDPSLWTHAYPYLSPDAAATGDYADFALAAANPFIAAPSADSDKLRTAGRNLFDSAHGTRNEGLGFDSYLDPPGDGAGVYSTLSGFLHSPGLPPLSSAASTPSSSSALLTPYGGPLETTPPHAHNVAVGLALPPPVVAATEDGLSAGSTSSGSCFAELQESFLAQHPGPSLVAVGAPPPSSHDLAYSASAPPTTPRRDRPSPAATHLWRSPSSHSVASSPTKSPYAQRAKPYDRPLDSSPSKEPSYFDSPTKTIMRRNMLAPRQASTQSDDAPLSPSRLSRRQQKRLSIDVPSRYGVRSTLPVIAASPQVPSNDGRFPSLDHATSAVESGHELDVSETTLQQVEDLLQEFGPLAPSGSYNTFSHQATHGPPSPLVLPGQNGDDTRYCVSGVALSLEDLAQLDDPSLTAAFATNSLQPCPSSAPPDQTTFSAHDLASPAPYSLSVPYGGSSDAGSSPGYAYSSYPSSPVYDAFLSAPSLASSTSSNGYNSHIRSVSAPRSAYHPTQQQHNFAAALSTYAEPVSHSLAQTHSTHSLPSHSSPPRTQLRRRSSIATASPSTTSSIQASSSWAHYPPRPHPTHPSHSYGPPPPASPSTRRRSPYHNVPLPLRPAPPLGSTYDPSPPPSPTKPAPAPGSKPVGEGSPTKKKKANGGGGGGGAKARNPQAMFVNFSAADAKKLLSGVAPSGSSKKKREEEEAAAARQSPSSNSAPSQDSTSPT